MRDLDWSVQDSWREIFASLSPFLMESLEVWAEEKEHDGPRSRSYQRLEAGDDVEQLLVDAALAQAMEGTVEAL